VFRPYLIADAEQRFGEVLQAYQHLPERQLPQIDPPASPPRLG
jgi:hypothetical protein